jgi:hypothetical protein
LNPPSQPSEEYRVAVHEFGHFLACVHYGIHATPKVFSAAERYVAADGQAIMGECRMARNGTKFEASAIAWAGMLAEHLVGVGTFDVPFPLKKSTLPEWFSIAMCQTMTPSDRSMIFGYEAPWRSFKAAYRILSRKRWKLARLAQLKASSAMREPRNEPTIPTPGQFPASRADFLRLVVAEGHTGDPAERYDEFINHRVRAFWFWSSRGAGDFNTDAPLLKERLHKSIGHEHRQTHPGKSDEEIAQVLFDDAFRAVSAKDRERFEQGFQTQIGWVMAAREYRKWAEAASLHC